MVERHEHTTAGNRRQLAALFTLPLLVGLLIFLFPAVAHADGIFVYSYQVDEEYTIEVDQFGDAKCTDVLAYDGSFFNKQGFNFDHYPFLLSRRFCEPCDVREIENFNSDIDSTKATITLTFDQPGKAYNQGTCWEMYGFYSKPKFEVDGKQVFEEESSVNSEFTLWQDLEFKTTTFVKLPEGAENVHYSEDKNALVWELPYVPVATSALAANQEIFIPVGSFLVVAALAATTVLFLRFRPRGVAAVAVPIEEIKTNAQLTDGQPPRAVITERPIPPALQEPPQTTHSRFCRHCGESLGDSESRFCPMCGQPTGARRE